MAKRNCSIDNCERPVRTLGMCGTHYTKQWASLARLRTSPPATERYESYVDRTTTPDGCHPWTGAVGRRGYGKLGVNGKHWPAHRYGWTLYVGPIPDGQIVRHYICDNPPCQNIDHLRIGTSKDNTADMLSKGRNWQATRRLNYNNGEANSKAKLTEADVRCIRRSYVRGVVTHQALADEFGVSTALISMIVTRKLWTHVA